MVGDGMFFLKNKKRNKENRAFFLFLAPSLLGVVIFVVLPFLDVFKRSFTTAVTGQFRGIENYKIIFTNQAFHLAVKNTLYFTAVCMAFIFLRSAAKALRPAEYPLR